MVTWYLISLITEECLLMHMGHNILRMWKHLILIVLCYSNLILSFQGAKIPSVKHGTGHGVSSSVKVTCCRVTRDFSVLLLFSRKSKPLVFSDFPRVRKLHNFTQNLRPKEAQTPHLTVLLDLLSFSVKSVRTKDQTTHNACSFPQLKLPAFALP